MTTYLPYCFNYVTWKNEDGSFKTTQIKKFPKNVSKKVLQSYFKTVAMDLLGEELVIKETVKNPALQEVFLEPLVLTKIDYIKLGQKMVELFQTHEIYNRKTEQERKDIENFLRFHTETIELSMHVFDKKYCEITDNYEITKIKDNAPFWWVVYLCDCILRFCERQNNKNPFEILGKKSKEELFDLLLNKLKQTNYFRLNKKENMVSQIKPALEELYKKQHYYIISEDSFEVEDLIIKQTIKFHKKSTD